MKEVPVRHLNLRIWFGSYSTSFFVNKKRKDMEQQMTTLGKHLMAKYSTLINTAFGSVCSNALTVSLKRERFYGEDSIDRRRGRSLCDLTFV